MRGRDAKAGSELEQGRKAYASRTWLEAHASFASADGSEPLGAADLELRATAAYMLGRDDEWAAFHERAHRLHLDAGEIARAARCAFWIGLGLALRGDIGPASGWFGRAQRLLDGQSSDSAERGFLLIPQALEHLATGDVAAAGAAAAEAVAIGDRFGDRDLFALGVLTQGQVLAVEARVDEGLALLDEAMVAVTAEDLSPVVTGIVYCAVILTCQQVFEVRRAREWTLALDRWSKQQPDLVSFTGRCLVHRAEILQLGGSWPDALAEARAAGRRFSETSNPAVGLASYREGELLRLQGELAAAEEAYRSASRSAWEPQPGLAQLRLAQGRADAAAAAIRRASAETSDPLKRAALLPAFVEIMLALDAVGEAQEACRELEDIASRYSSSMLAAMVAHARGAVELARGEPRSALIALRSALDEWQALDAPYEVARTRVLVGLACHALGDEDAYTLELEGALAAFRELGAWPDVARVEEIVGGSAPRDTHGLSGRELEVLRLLATGKSNRDIASTLVISEHTVARHVQNIFAKLRVSSRAAATAFAFEHDLV
jgi:DNA-binding CsgD family transcriptional regulator/tetratricopeptide (TPR) repeat protein